MDSSDIRLLAMLAGWACALYGIYRRDRIGTITAMAGLGVATASLSLGKRTA
jgi:hypothetical protein